MYVGSTISLAYTAIKNSNNPPIYRPINLYPNPYNYPEGYDIPLAFRSAFNETDDLSESK